MGTMQEDVEYLEKWLDEAECLAKAIKDQASKANLQSVFTISTTAKIQQNGYPFLTPLRQITHGFIGGSIVFSQTQALLLCKRIDGLVDEILVDAEKKIGITLGIDEHTLTHFGILGEGELSNARVHVEMGNLSAACFNHVQKSSFREFKANDLTVEAVWHYLSSWYSVLSGKRIAIIGSGNIGFKLGVKLVECGCQVELVRRDLVKGTLMANAINIVKPQSTLSNAHYNSDPLQASLFADVIIGCTDGIPVITWEMIQCMKPLGIVIDVGKGSIHKKAIQKALQENINIVRCDISSAMDGLIATMHRNRTVIKMRMGRKEIQKGIFVVSGGYMGLEGDIIVDSYQTPTRIIGVADGMGDLMKDISIKNKQDIDQLIRQFSIS